MRQLLNILIVWLATGLWHGAAWNFVLWGLLFAVLLILAAVGATPLPKKLAEAAGRSKTGAGVIGVLEPLALAALLAVCTAFLVDGSFNPFLYFRF